jgi:hypothetical protein
MHFHNRPSSQAFIAYVLVKSPWFELTFLHETCAYAVAPLAVIDDRSPLALTGGGRAEAKHGGRAFAGRCNPLLN